MQNFVTTEVPFFKSAVKAALQVAIMAQKLSSLAPCAFATKGQLISKKIVKPRILLKNEQMNSFLLVCDVFSFVFCKNPWLEKKRFEIIWPLEAWPKRG